MDRRKLLDYGPRTGKNIKQGRDIRKLEDGCDRFDDYWTDDESSDSLEATTVNSQEPLSNEPVLLSTSTETVKKSLKVYDSSPSIKVHKKSYVKKTVEKSFFLDSKKELPEDGELYETSDTNDYQNNYVSKSHNFSLSCSPIRTKRTNKTSNFMDKHNIKESIGLSKSPEKEYKKSERCLQDSKVHNLNTKAADTGLEKHKMNSKSNKNLLNDKSEIASTLERTYYSNQISSEDENTYYEKSTVSDAPSLNTEPIIISKKAFILPSSIREPKKLSNKFSKEDKISVTLSQKDVEAFKLKKRAERASKMDKYDVNIMGMADENQRILTSEKNTGKDTSNISEKRSSEKFLSDAENIPVENNDLSSPVRVKVTKKISKLVDRSPNIAKTQNLTMNKMESPMDAYDSKILNMIQENDDQHINNTSNVPNIPSKHQLNKLSSVVGTKTAKSYSEEVLNDSKKDEVSPLKISPKMRHRNFTSKNSHKITNPKTKNIGKSILNTEMVNNDNVSVVNEVSSPKSISLSPSKATRNLFNCSVADDENVVETHANIQTKKFKEHIKIHNKRSSTVKLKDLAKTMQSSPKKTEVIEELPSFSKVPPSGITEKRKTLIEQCAGTVNEDNINSDDYAEDTESYEDDSVNEVQSHDEHAEDMEAYEDDSVNEVQSHDEHAEDMEAYEDDSVNEVQSHDEHNKSNESCDSLKCQSQAVSHHEENLNSSKYVAKEETNDVAITSTPIKNAKRTSSINKINFEAGRLKSFGKQKCLEKAETPKGEMFKNMDIRSEINLNSSQHSDHNDEIVDKAKKLEKTTCTKKDKKSKPLKTRTTDIKKNLNSSQHPHINEEIHDVCSNTPTKISKRQSKNNDRSYEDYHSENIGGKKISEKTTASKGKVFKNMDIQSETDPNSSQHSDHNDEMVDKTEKSEKTVHTKKNKASKLISSETRNTNIKENLNSSQHLDEESHDTDSNTSTKNSKKQSEKNKRNEDCHLENGGNKISEKPKAPKQITCRSIDIQIEDNLNCSQHSVQSEEETGTLSGKKRNPAVQDCNNSYHSGNSPDVFDGVIEADITLQTQSPIQHTFDNGFESDASKKKMKQDMGKIKALNTVPESIRSPSSKRTKKQKSLSLKRKKASTQTFTNLDSSEHSVRDNNIINEAAENSVSEIIGKQSSMETTDKSPEKVQRTTDKSPKSVQEGQHNLNQPEFLKEVSTGTLNMPLPSKKSKKKKSNYLNKSNDLNCRRSKRQRHAPVAHWRNERILYEFEEGIPKIQGIQKATVDDFLSYHLTNTKATKNRKVIKNTNKCKNNSKRKVSVGVEYYSGTPWDIPPEMSTDENYMIKRMFENDKCGFGYIKIKPGKIKPLQYMPDDDLQFSVFKGFVEVTVGEKSFNLEQKDFVFVPRKNAYSIKNVGTYTAILQFSVSDFSDNIE